MRGSFARALASGSWRRLLRGAGGALSDDDKLASCRQWQHDGCVYVWRNERVERLLARHEQTAGRVIAQRAATECGGCRAAG